MPYTYTEHFASYKCDTCGRITKKDYRGKARYKLHGLYFPELEGHPFICSACIYKSLTGKSVDFTDLFKGFIENGEIS